MGVAKATFYKYFKFVKGNPDLRLVDYIHNGKPRTYPLEVDVALIKFVKNPKTLLIEKGIKNLMKHYIELMKERSASDSLSLLREQKRITSCH